MLKVNPHPDYPPEEGRYIRGNDFSPVAVAVILNCDGDKIPPELEKLVRAGLRLLEKNVHILAISLLAMNSTI